MARALAPLALISLVLIGAIFGFFYAWICSTMWGLDMLDPNDAIRAMNAMNASVRNGVFMPAFFLTPFFLAATAGLAALAHRRDAAVLFGLASVIYAVGGIVLTALVNVPMNEALALVMTPLDPETAQQTWQDYSARWQFWNQTRTIIAGVALVLTGLALIRLNKGKS